MVRLLLCALFLLSGCSRQPRADLVFLNGAEPETLDPALITGQPEGRVANALFEGLLTFDEHGKLRPGMAESWEVTPDGRVYTFTLRDGLTWSDGQPVTAQDFADSWRRTLDPATASAYAYQLHYIKNATAFNLYGADAEAILGPRNEETLLAGVQRLRTGGAPVTLKAWRAFLSDKNAQEHLKDCVDPAVLAALSVREDPLSDVVLDALEPALEREGERRRAEHAYAVEHLGRDAGFYAPDDHTFVVELAAPTPFFLDLCAFVTLLPVPLHAIDKHGDNWTKPGNLVGNGAYVLDAWRLNDRIRLRKNPRYWNAENVALETIDVIPVSKANTAFNLYASGRADLMMDKGLVPPALLGEIKKRSDFHAAPFLGTYFLRYSCEKGPFADPRVRKAFSLVIDKPSIVERITRAGELPADSFVPPGAAGYQPYNSCGKRDVAEAKRLLAEAGYPDGKGFPMVNYLYSEGELNEAIAVELQSMWRRELGVNVQLLRQEWKVYLRSLSSLDFDIARSSWVGDYPDPNTFLDMFVTGGGNNRTGWSDPRYDKLIADAAAETNPQTRFDVLREAEKILVCEQMPVCPLYFYVGIQLYDVDKLGGVAGNVLDEHPLRVMFWKNSGK